MSTSSPALTRNPALSAALNTVNAVFRISCHEFGLLFPLKTEPTAQRHYHDYLSTLKISRVSCPDTGHMLIFLHLLALLRRAARGVRGAAPPTGNILSVLNKLQVGLNINLR